MLSSTSFIIAFKLVFLAVSVVMMSQNRWVSLSQSVHGHAHISGNHGDPLRISNPSDIHDSHRIIGSKSEGQRTTHAHSKILASRFASHDPVKNHHRPNPLIAAASIPNIAVKPAAATLGLEANDGADVPKEVEQEVKLQPLSWDKSWWSGGAWLLWLLSCVGPTALIFVLNGLTQVSPPPPPPPAAAGSTNEKSIGERSVETWHACLGKSVSWMSQSEKGGRLDDRKVTARNVWWMVVVAADRGGRSCASSAK